MTTTEIIRRVVTYGGIVGLVILVVGGVIGILLAGLPGLLSAVLGTGVAALFTGVSVAAVLAALKVSRGQLSSLSFVAIVLVGLVLKFVVFLVLVLVVSGVTWLDPRVAFGALVAAMIGSLIVDVTVLAGARAPLAAAMDVEEDTLGGPARPKPAGRGAASKSE